MPTAAPRYERYFAGRYADTKLEGEWGTPPPDREVVVKYVARASGAIRSVL